MTKVTMHKKVKEYISTFKPELKVSTTFLTQLDLEVVKTIEQACSRAKSNDRVTVMDRDL